MSETVEVSPFFERGETSYDGFPADTYVAGFRASRGTSAGVAVTLPAEIVGRLVLDADGLSDDVLEAAGDAGGIRDQTLESLVSGCLNLDLLGGEDDPIGDLTALRGQMVRALAQLDTTVEQLKKTAR